MNPWTGTKRKIEGLQAHPALILAADQADAAAYAETHQHGNYIAITPRSIVQVRGRTGPVYATRRARTHARYREMLQEAKPCGAAIPRTPRDRRVA